MDELIKALRCCASLDTSCEGLCSYHGVEYCSSKKDLDAADALEAAEKQIARLEEDLKMREAEREVMQDTIKVCEKRIVELEKQAEHTDQVDAMIFATHLKQVARIAELESQAAFFDAEKLNYQENIEYRDERIKELEAQLPKEGEWIGVHDWLHIPQEERGTYRCSACGQVMKYPWNYCPNCGAKMDGERKDGERDGET